MTKRKTCGECPAWENNRCSYFDWGCGHTIEASHTECDYRYAFRVVRDKYRMVKDQRDVALEACEAVFVPYEKARSYGEAMGMDTSGVDRILEMLRCAIAKARGEG